METLRELFIASADFQTFSVLTTELELLLTSSTSIFRSDWSWSDFRSRMVALVDGAFFR